MDGSDYPFPGLLIKTNPYNFTSVTNSSGMFNLFSDVTGDSVKGVLPVPYSSTQPGYYLVNGETSGRDFALYVSPDLQDLSIDVTNVNVFRPGFNTTLTLMQAVLVLI